VTKAAASGFEMVHGSQDTVSGFVNPGFKPLESTQLIGS